MKNDYPEKWAGPIDDSMVIAQIQGDADVLSWLRQLNQAILDGKVAEWAHTFYWIDQPGQHATRAVASKYVRRAIWCIEQRNPDKSTT